MSYEVPKSSVDTAMHHVGPAGLLQLLSKYGPLILSPVTAV